MVRVQKLRRKYGMKASPISMHMVFLGNPGTGKTTVARLMGDIFRSLGLLSKGHTVEVDREGLVGKYIGETAPKTKEAVKRAMGVLFIDEAYLLTSNTPEGDYVPEAVGTLVKEMEDNREDLAVIVAGYIQEMQDFIKSNPGLKSRFADYIHFEDYSPSEMLEIFRRMCEEEGYSITSEATDQAYALFER
jgi:stage V sporulation protein K